MAVQFPNSMVVLASTWTVFEANLAAKALTPRMQYDDDGIVYTIFAFDGPLVYTCTIWKSTVPASVINSGYSQSQNDTDKTDFETNYKSSANKSLDSTLQQDTLHRIHKLGNITTTSTSEVIVSTRPYVELASQRQCSVQSTSVQDKPSGSGAKQVRITYLDSNYVLKSEDVTLNGTTKVNTVATDIRFIEKFQVIQGAAAVGALQLMDGTTGGASEFCGIAVGTTDAFLCHHYVPAGKTCYVLRWEMICDDEANCKLYGQNRYNGNLVDEILDLYKLFGGNPTPPTVLTFAQLYQSPFVIPEKCYIRPTVVPNQSTSTTTRALLDLWEE